MSAGQRENLEAILRQSAFPFDSSVSEQRRLLAEFASAQPLPPGVTVTAAALGGVPTAEITIDGIGPRHVVLYFHGGVYVIGDALQAAGLAPQVGRRTPASCHRRRAGHPRHHPWGAARLPGLLRDPRRSDRALDRAGQFLSAHLASAERITALGLPSPGPNTYPGIVNDRSST